MADLENGSDADRRSPPCGALLDLTERRRVEESLRECEQRYRFLFHRNPDGVFAVDTAGRFVLANPACERISGYSAAELRERTAFELCAPDQLTKVLAQFERIVREQTYRELETALIRKDGRRVEVWLAGEAIVSNGETTVIHCTAKDITERKQAEADLRSSEGKYRRLHQSMRDALACVGMDGVIQEFNESYGRMLGYEPEELRTLRYFDITPEKWHASEAEIVRTQVLPRGYSDIYEKEYRRKDGTVFPVELRTFLIRDRKGQPAQMWAIVRDITERKRVEEALRASEDRFRRLFEDDLTGDFIATPEGRLLVCNPAFVRIFGFSSREEATGSNLSSLHPSPQGFADFLRLVKDHGSLYHYECERRRRDGAVVHIAENVIGTFDEQGELVQFKGYVFDVTERKQAEEQLKALNETLEHRVAERAAEAQWRANQLQRLAAQMSQAEERERRRLAQVLHDGLQQVLIAARLRLTVAARRAQDERAAAAIEEAHDLINEAIAESRSLTKELSPPVLYDGGLAAGLEWLGRETEKKHQLPVTVQVAPEMEPDDLTTKVFVFQAARELILNAVKHAHASTLRVCLSGAGDDRLRVVIEDDGTGFDPAIMNRTEGGGFGLFSIRERLDVIGGELTMWSSPMEGTKATILAPCRRTRRATRPAATVKNALPLPPTPERATRIRVLLADDHPLLRKGLADMLVEHPDLNLIGEAGDGQEAIALALQLRPDVVLMDVTMPQMDGIEATRRIKQVAPEISVIGLSMHETEAMALAMKNAGASHYLTKSAPMENLIAAILGACPRRI